ncbi:MAG TPA: class I SAM-dependent methyltransferase [Gaiellaceae bacterium]
MAEMEWDPDLYLRTIREEIPRFDEFQDAVAAATGGVEAHAVLELGVGTGETARRVRLVHPDASWTGIDASAPMLARARETLPDADLHVSRLEDPLPGGPFDLVVSALAVHHLPAEGKQGLFRRIAAIVRPGGLFVLGDVVVPERPEDAQIEIDWVVDLPDRAEDQLVWLDSAGFDAVLVWSHRDLAVIRAVRR